MSEMTIDEAIEDCLRQVPELNLGCDPDFLEAWTAVRTGFIACSEKWAKKRDSLDAWMRQRHFFEAAWEWLMVSEAALAIEYAGGGKWAVRFENVNHWAIEQPFPTKYHALRAAVLLAKGLKP